MINKIQQPTKLFRTRLDYLGNAYTSKVIDGELCGYRKINDFYDIEISGLNNNKLKHPSFNVYVWQIKSGLTTVETHFDIKSIETLKRVLSELCQKYQNLAPKM